MTRYGVGLGSNVGDRASTLRSAVQSISTFVTELVVSALYESAPVGGPEQGPFLNAAVSFESELDPQQLLSRLQGIEADHGRVRNEHWGPRTLDLDIIVSELDPVDHGPDLIIPHPRAATRRFVIEPLREVWPESEVAPGQTWDDLYPGLADQDVDRLAANWVDDHSSTTGRRLVAGQLIFFLAIGFLLVLDGSIPTIGEWGFQEFAGLVLALSGGYLMWRSAVALGSNLTILPGPVAGGSLVTSGPFRLVRHPIYTGVVIMFVGSAQFLGSMAALIATLLLSVYFYFKARYEERQLRIAYSGYWHYMDEVPRMLVPFLI